MPIVSLINHEYRYPLEDILRLFYGKDISYLEATDRELVEQEIRIQAGDDTPVFSIVQDRFVETRSGEIRIRSDHPVDNEIELKRELKRQLYYVCSRLTTTDFPWGSLTGIRPTFVAAQLLEMHEDEEIAARELTDFFFVSEEKARLAIETAKMEQALLAGFDTNNLALYIGIPFCPTRCSYCSFSSFEGIGRPEDEMERYLDALIHELELLWKDEAFRATLDARGTKIQAIYIGGGTPTALSTRQLERLCSTIHDLDLPFAQHAEWTVEAGRPDTIDPEKLVILKAAGFQRISVNPQSMVDETLKRIGRMHGSESIRVAFDQARAAGFDNINMDLIAGLAGESREDFRYSLREVLSMNPESITVHNLALKRGSRLHRLMVGTATNAGEASQEEQSIGQLYQPDPDVAWMLQHARDELAQAGYRPYYLYRQKDGRGGLENVGFAKSGKENLYNIAMMGDQRSVMGFGAGSSSKHGFGRHANLRNIRQYMQRVDEMAERKKALWEMTAETEV